MRKVLIVKSILLLDESLHKVPDPGSQSTPPTYIIRVVILLQWLWNLGNKINTITQSFGDPIDIFTQDSGWQNWTHLPECLGVMDTEIEYLKNHLKS